MEFKKNINEKVDVIILAGGLGTRLREVVSDVPKVMAPINARPFLDILLNFLNKWDCIGRVIIAVGYMAHKIINEYKNSDDYNFKILFSEEKELLGTGGAIKRALKYAGTDNILSLNGDTYIDVNLKDFIEFHKSKNSDMTIVLKEVENANRYGLVKINGDKKVIFFREKQQTLESGYINAGMYVLKRRLFESIEDGEVFSLERELLPLFLKKKIYGYVSNGKFIDIGIPETYKILSSYLTKELK